MSLRPANSRPARSTSRILASLSLIAVAMTLATPAVSAGGGNNLNWSPDLGQVCISAFGSSVVISTTVAPNLDEPGNPWANPIRPTGTFTSGPPLVLNFTVPDAFFDSERFHANDPDEVAGFYMMGFQFVDDCTSRQPTWFTPCFQATTGPDPWVLDFGDTQLLFFMYVDQTGFGSVDQLSVLQISDGSSGCTPEVPDGGPGITGPGDLVDLIDEFDLEFAGDLDFGFDYNIDIDHYRRMAAAQEENALPSTL